MEAVYLLKNEIIRVNTEDVEVCEALKKDGATEITKKIYCDIKRNFMRVQDSNNAAKTNKELQKAIHEVKKDAEKLFGVPAKQLRKKTNEQRYSYARYCVAYVLDVYTTLSRADIGYICGIDHSTVTYGVYKMREMMRYDKKIKARLGALLEKYEQIIPKITNEQE